MVRLRVDKDYFRGLPSSPVERAIWEVGMNMLLLKSAVQGLVDMANTDDKSSKAYSIAMENYVELKASYETAKDDMEFVGLALEVARERLLGEV